MVSYALVVLFIAQWATKVSNLKISHAGDISFQCSLVRKLIYEGVGLGVSEPMFTRLMSARTCNHVQSISTHTAYIVCGYVYIYFMIIFEGNHLRIYNVGVWHGISTLDDYCFVNIFRFPFQINELTLI